MVTHEVATNSWKALAAEGQNGGALWAEYEELFWQARMDFDVKELLRAPYGCRMRGHDDPGSGVSLALDVPPPSPSLPPIVRHTFLPSRHTPLPEELLIL